MGPSSHCHRKSCTAASLHSPLPHLLILRLRSGFALCFRFFSALPSFRTLKTTQVRNLDPLSFPLPSVSVRFRFLFRSSARFLRLSSLPLRFPPGPLSLPAVLAYPPRFLPTSARFFASLTRFRFSASHGFFPAPCFFLRFSDQALDRLVSASSHVTMLSPLTYLPCRLQGVLLACAMAVFFLRWASRLDAFSVYPLRTSLPCYAVGTTTVAPVVRPSRSSRTRDSSSHDSCAHDG